MRMTTATDAGITAAIAGAALGILDLLTFKAMPVLIIAVCAMSCGLTAVMLSQFED